jgi:type II secretory pathway component PulJ
MTLIETVIGALIFSSVIGGVYMLYTTMQNTMHRGELQSDLQQHGRVALAQMVQEIRATGYDPQNSLPSVITLPRASIRAAMPSCLSFVAFKRNKDTGLDESKQITYKLTGAALQRREDIWNRVQAPNEFSGGTDQDLAQFVEVLAFTYYAADNAILTPASFSSTQRCPPDPNATALVLQQLTFDQMRQIRRVAITVKTKGTQPGIQAEFFTLKADVYLRNL